MIPVIMPEYPVYYYFSKKRFRLLCIFLISISNCDKIESQTYFGVNIGIEKSELRSYDQSSSDFYSLGSFNKTSVCYTISLDQYFLKYFLVNLHASLTQKRYELYPSGCFFPGSINQFNRWDKSICLMGHVTHSISLGMGAFISNIYSMDEAYSTAPDYTNNNILNIKASGVQFQGFYRFKNFKLSLQYLKCLKNYDPYYFPSIKQINSVQLLFGYFIKCPKLFGKKSIQCPSFRKT